MATDTRDKTPGGTRNDSDPIQERYDREFNGMVGAGLHEVDHPFENQELPDEDALNTVRNGEENPATESQNGKAEAANKGEEGFYKQKTDDGNQGQTGGIRGRFRSLTSSGGGQSGGIPRPVKYAAAGGIIGTLVLFLVIIGILFSLFGSLKVVHFATVLRSAGLARFTLQMQKQYTRTMVNAAAMTDNSTGSLSKALGDRSLTQKLRGVNPQKRAISLGEQDKLKFDFQKGSSWGGLKKSNDFHGVTIDGESLTLDQFAQKSFGKSYANLSTRERFTVESQFANDVKVRLGITDRLSLRGLWFRSDVYAIFRQATGINMIKWVNKAKDYLGKKPQEALKQNVDDTIKAVDENAGATASANDQTNKEKDELRKTAVDNAEKGITNTGLKAKSAKIASITKDISVAAFATTAACIVHDLNNSFKEAGKQTQDRAARLGHDALTAGDQIKQGDTTGEAVGAEATRWNSAEKSALYKQQTGSPLSNSDMTQLVDIPSIQGPASTFASIIKYTDAAFSGASPIFQLPVVGGKAKDLTCNVVLNQYTQYGIAGAELVVAVFTAGAEEGILQGVKAAIIGSLKLAGTVGIGQLLGYLMDKAVHAYAGLDYSATDNNEKLYNESYVGVDYLQQTGTRQATYGRPLTAAEASAEQTTAITAMVEENKHASFTQRYFAIDNPYSLIGEVAAKTPSSLGNVSSSARSGLAFVGSLLSSPQLLMQHLGSLFMPRVAAADPMVTGANYGVDEHGWLPPEWQKVSTDASFSTTPDASGDSPIEKYVAPNLDAWDTKYGPCYAYTKQSDKPTDHDCSAATLGTDQALHWRFYKALGCSADSMKPDNPTGNCAFAKTASAATATATPTDTATANIDMAHLYDDSTSVACAQGTDDLGNAAGTISGYAKGKPVDIKLCRIKGFKCSCSGAMKRYTSGKIDSQGDVAVNSRVSGAWLALFDAAKTDGVTMQANSAFRTYAYQQSLCPCNGVMVAKPGYSNHQMGLALDLANSGYSSISYGDKWHNWMKANAGKFGLKQYSAESWHWSPTGN